MKYTNKSHINLIRISAIDMKKLLDMQNSPECQARLVIDRRENNESN